MKFLTFEEVADFIRGKTVAIVGSAPTVLYNEPGAIDAHDLVCRVNNYKLGSAQGYRTDIHYSFYGNSIRKTADDLRSDRVKMCLCKCPDGQPIDSEWHREKGKLAGIDFSYIYRTRKDWWPADTFIPSTEHFLRSFRLLGNHIPTTGFSAILDILAADPEYVYLTGFDFFESKIHNVDEPWREGDPTDPIGHRPDLERKWLQENLGNERIVLDRKLNEMIAGKTPT